MSYIIGFLAAILFGSNGSVVKVVVNSGVSAAQITFFRVAAALLIAFVILLLTERTAFRISAKRMLGMAILGIAGVAMLQWLYALAITRIPVGIALLFEYLAVLAVAVVARFVFKEAVRGRIWIAIGLVLAGLAVVAQVWTSNLDAFGMLFALGAAAALSVYFIMGERALTGMSVMSMTFWSMLFASLFWGIFSGWWQMDPSLFTQDVSMTGSLAAVILPMWVPLLWAVVIGSFVAFYLSFVALKHLKATSAGIVASSEVIFAFIVAWVWLGEALSLTQILGALIVVAGIILAQTARPGKVIDLDLASRTN